MCSKQCPCKTKDKAMWDKVSENALQSSYSRTKKVKLNNFTPLVFDDKLRSKDVNKKDNAPNTFYDCFFAWQSAWELAKGKGKAFPDGFT